MRRYQRLAVACRHFAHFAHFAIKCIATPPSHRTSASGGAKSAAAAAHHAEDVLGHQLRLPSLGPPCCESDMYCPLTNPEHVK